jgi:hypothetical protein
MSQYNIVEGTYFSGPQYNYTITHRFLSVKLHYYKRFRFLYK